MQQISVGTWLIATDLLDGSDFEKAKIFIHQSDENGVVGFMVNKFFGSDLNELAEFAHSKPVALHDGGPVDKEHLFVLHCKPDIISGSKHIIDDIYFGGNFSEAVAAINRGHLSVKQIFIFIGYSGWDRGELEEEIEEGSWKILPTGAEKLFRFNDGN